MTLLVGTILAALGVRGLLDVWFYGSIFADRRAICEIYRDGSEGLTRFIGALMSCRFCLTTHLAFWASLTTLSGLCAEGSVTGWVMLVLPFNALAVFSLVRILDQYLPSLAPNSPLGDDRHASS